jgi:hypothetical protein
MRGWRAIPNHQRRHAAQHKQRTRPGGGTGRSDLASRRGHAAQSGRSQDQRRAEALAEHRHRLVEVARVDQHPRAKGNPLERRSILAERDFVLRPAVDEVEHCTRQPAFRKLAQVVNVNDGHISGSLYVSENSDKELTSTLMVS